MWDEKEEEDEETEAGEQTEPKEEEEEVARGEEGNNTEGKRGPGTIFKVLEDWFPSVVEKEEA